MAATLPGKIRSTRIWHQRNNQEGVQEQLSFLKKGGKGENQQGKKEVYPKKSITLKNAKKKRVEVFPQNLRDLYEKKKKKKGEVREI